jgi:hypothetical protein
MLLKVVLYRLWIKLSNDKRNFQRAYWRDSRCRHAPRVQRRQ